MTTPEENTPEENMKATPEDKLGAEPPRRGGFPLRAVVVVALIAVGLLLMFYPSGEDAPPEPEAEAPAAEPRPEPLPPAEDIPAPAPPEPAESPEEAAAEPEPEPGPVEEPLPGLGESDPLMREEIVAAGTAGELDGFAEGENLLQRLVALVDGASRGVLLRKILPMEAPDEPFPVETRNGGMTMSEAGYDRYDPYVEAILALDTGTLVEAFHRLRPLFEEAYAELGLAPEEFDNAVIRTLDRVIATPEIESPIALERESVMYTYADPDLEALPALQKQLLRMGPENIRQLKEKARALRVGLLEP